MFEKLLKKETIATAKELVRDNQTAVIVGTVVLTVAGILLIRKAFPTTIVNNYVWAGGCWSPYHIPGGFVR
jgi:hypothetical protein